jgi:ABC-type branched-subunit amino acid transport system substrate-binding protein
LPPSQCHQPGVAWRQRALTACAVSLAFLAAACGGSALDADYALAANAAVQGNGVGSTASDGGTSTTMDDPAGTPGDPATTDGGNDLPGVVGSRGSQHGGAGGDPVPALGHQASCAGFRNQTGITNSTITLANVADVSGPVPGIFTSAQLATRAFAMYFNATSKLCGRKLEVLSLDSRTDTVGDQVAYTKACNDAFAVVGSMSAFDTGGAATAQHCGLPDIRALAVSDARNACSTCFGVQATDLHAFQNAVPDFFVEHYTAASQRAAMIYVNAAASVQNAKVQQAAAEKRGMKFVYSAHFDVAEFNYSPYVQRMKDAGVRLVQFVGSSDQAVRLARAMQGAGFEPDVFLLDPTAYDPLFVKSGGDAVDGAFVFIDFVPREEATRSPELRLYRQWLQQVSPGAVPTYFGLFAWSAARLFVEQAAGLGGKLGRASLVDRMRKVRAWTDHGLHAPQDVGGKTNSNCWRFLRLHDGRWAPVGGSQYLCRGETRVG